MRRDVHGGVRAFVILSGGVGFHPKQKGERRRKSVRGSVITEDTVQINMKVVEKPRKKPSKQKSEKPPRAAGKSRRRSSQKS